MVPYPEPRRVAEGGVAVFADAHLGQAEGDGDDFLAALDDVAARGFGTIVLLGDIFHYFIGSAKLETPLIRRVLAGWDELSRRGSRASVHRREPRLLPPRDALGEGVRRVRRHGWPPGRRAKVRLRPRRPDQHPRPSVSILAARLEEPRLPRGTRPDPGTGRSPDRRKDGGAPLPDELPAQERPPRGGAPARGGAGSRRRLRRAPRGALPRGEALRRRGRVDPHPSRLARGAPARGDRPGRGLPARRGDRAPRGPYAARDRT